MALKRFDADAEIQAREFGKTISCMMVDLNGDGDLDDPGECPNGPGRTIDTGPHLSDVLKNTTISALLGVLDLPSRPEEFS